MIDINNSQAKIVELEINPDDLKKLKDDVNQALSLNIRARTAVNKLLKTDKTFDNSLGDIYEYIKNLSDCNNCSGKLFECPLKDKGYIIDIYYDEDLDRIFTKRIQCKYLLSLQPILENIKISNIDPLNIYIDSSKFLANLFNAKPDMYLDIKSATRIIANSIKTYSKEKENKSYAFHGISDKNISKLLLELASFNHAKAGQKVAYFDTVDLYKYINDYSVDQEWRDDFFKTVCKVPVLCLQNFDLYPNSKTFDLYKNLGININYQVAKDKLYQLLQARNKEGKVTYISLDDSKTISNKLKASFKGDERLNEIISLFNKLNNIVEIKDNLL